MVVIDWELPSQKFAEVHPNKKSNIFNQVINEDGTAVFRSFWSVEAVVFYFPEPKCHRS